MPINNVPNIEGKAIDQQQHIRKIATRTMAEDFNSKNSFSEKKQKTGHFTTALDNQQVVIKDQFTPTKPNKFGPMSATGVNRQQYTPNNPNDRVFTSPDIVIAMNIQLQFRDSTNPRDSGPKFSKTSSFDQSDPFSKPL